MKKCMYCSAKIEDVSVVEICEDCMNNVWGSKMAATIVSNMEKQRENGDLDLWKGNNV